MFESPKLLLAARWNRRDVRTRGGEGNQVSLQTSKELEGIMERASKLNGMRNIVKAVYMPEASVGTCRNIGKCGQVNVDLANGLCVFCWDRGPYLPQNRRNTSSTHQTSTSHSYASSS